MIRRQERRYGRLGACGVLVVALSTSGLAKATEPVRGCATELFRDRVVAITPAGADIDEILQRALWIKRVENPMLQDLPFEVYEVQYTLVRPSLTAYFIADEVHCQLVAGSLSELLKEEMTWEQERRFAIGGVNSFIKKKNHPPPTEDRALLRYAYGVATVLNVDEPIEILEDVSSLRRIVNETAIPPNDHQQVTGRITKALELYEVPRVRREHDVRVAEFFSWMSLGGALLRHRVSVLSDGTIDEHSETLVREVGRYTKVRYRM